MTDPNETALKLCERWFDKGARASWCPEMVHEFAQAIRDEREAEQQRIEHEVRDLLEGIAVTHLWIPYEKVLAAIRNDGGPQ
jgi:hypothetical protein